MEKTKNKKQWYVVRTYSGHEEKVVQNLKQRVEVMDLGDKIFQVIVPHEKSIEFRGGKRKEIEKRVFPGYVLVQMILDDNSWYTVRNTPSVMGFVGTEGKPTPLSEKEVNNIVKHMEKEAPDFQINFKVGDTLEIQDGPFKGMLGKVSDVDLEKGKVKLLLSIFGRETPVELNIMQVKIA